MANSKKRKTPSRGQKRTTTNININAYIVSGIVASLLLSVFIYTTATGAIGGAVKDIFFGLFGKTAYIIPIVLTFNVVYLIRKRQIKRFYLKLLLSFLAVSHVSAIVHLAGDDLLDLYSAFTYGQAGIGGGFIGFCIAMGLYKLVGTIAAFVILAIILFALITVITKVSLISVFATFVSGFKEEINGVKHIDTKEVGKKTKVAVNSTIKTIKSSRLKILEQTSIDLPINEEKQTGATVDGNTDFNSQEEPSENFQTVEEANHVEQKVEEFVSEFVRVSEKKKSAKINEEEKIALDEEIDDAIGKPVLDYSFPPISLLKKPSKISADLRAEMKETAAKLMDTFKNFGVEVKLLQVTQGPSVTRYEIQPDVGVKLSKIVGLADDIALNLAVPSVLIAPVPGKAAVGIDIPNNEVGSVSIRELIESSEFQKSKSKLTIALGKDIGGKIVIGDIAKMPHILIAGATGSGKSVCINTLITSILYKARPDEVKLIMVDPKVVELGVYNGIPHLLIPVVTDPKRAAGALNWAVQEMMKRYDAFAENKVRNLSGYNAIAIREGMEKMPQIVIIIDELADLMMVAAKEVEDYVCRLAQLARAAGIHLVIATQRPSVDVITGLIKANVPSRIAFSVSSQVDSRTILDKGGAEKLLGKGDMLYHPSGMANALRVQGAFVSDAEVESIVNYLKETGEKTSYSEDLAEHIDRCSSGENGVTPDSEDDGDELLPAAIELAVEAGQISTSMIQRRLKVGYARAGRIIDQMEMRGIISGADGSKPRQVYMSKSELWNEGETDEI
ncbi:MAG: DNA translocase FtsK [Clostridia bacterium]|nr:DNA translocase FtsK [Clostridia bacterium]